MAGAMEQRRPTRSELDREGARLGASFGLGGPPQGAYRARRRSKQWGCGTALLGWGAILAFVIPEWQHHYGSPWQIAAGVVAVAGAVVMVLAPRSKWDRLFWYPAGLAQQLTAEAEPKILRWADATGVRVAYETDDESLVLGRCLVDGPGELTIEADRRYKAGLKELVSEAERVFALTVLPGLTEACDRGQPVVFGALTITATGLGYQPQTRREEGWWLSWREIRVVKAHGPGRGLYVHPQPWGHKKRWVELGNVSNGVLAHRLIEHVAAPYRIPVSLTRE